MSAPLVFFVGGTRSGKSGLAQRWAEAQASRRLFLATCRVEDNDVEMAARVARHQAGRGAGWFCVEEPLDPLTVLKGVLAGSSGQDGDAAGVTLLDCVSLWVANLLAVGLTPEEIQTRVAALAVGLADEPGGRVRPMALVSAETGLGIVPSTPLGRVYRDVLGLANQTLAGVCTHVVFVSCGLPLALKGPLPEGL
ncbi:bifunctional adenosylcobinamide kinase/adenosylcobinamide-phosphate guanylyltransferase [uncultured Desulfovibrio sp.]|uniref:bifunctional adenosylcobinamide kinase/adenosylcobinamide-phosphate guanylyltransferase n=1 Tax=uncultured Desulfovibrio sp. TaxID=167968 RepID=UPI00261F861C|nr:bifunctional adenosylcobinamide kinase/adenosylcobinamide-phosphate guanylyltransferase [uncultured Desulfovibrio sp.]